MSQKEAKLRLVAGIAAVVTGGIHVLLGAIGVWGWITTGELHDILPPLFLVSGVAVLGGVYLFHAGRLPRKITYAAGVGVALVYIVGYADWHVFNTFESFVDLGELGHVHESGHEANASHDHEGGHSEESAVVVLVNHLIDDPVGLVSKISEGVLVSSLFVLYAVEEDYL